MPSSDGLDEQEDAHNSVCAFLDKMQPILRSWKEPVLTLVVFLAA